MSNPEDSASQRAGRRHEIRVFQNGQVSVLDLKLGETMHSSIGPGREALQVYVEQTALERRLRSAEEGALVLHDVGLGTASNALAAIECAEGLSARRPLRIVSFENDPSGLELAMGHAGSFPAIAGRRASLHALLERGEWVNADGSIRWALKLGDFLDQELAPAPEVIFYDFYSPKSAPCLWGWRAFTKIYEACRPRLLSHLPTVLATYSAATHVRAAMLLAGFHVGHGTKTDAKLETTVASTLKSELAHPLGEGWLRRLERSRRPLPDDLPETLTKARLLQLVSDGG